MKRTIFTVLPLLFGLLICKAQSPSLKTFSGKSFQVSELESIALRKMDELHVPGLSLAVINDNKVIYKHHFGFANWEKRTLINDNTLFEAASMTKPVIGFLTMKMVEEGLLDLDRPLHELLPYPDLEHDERYKKITARMVLSHTSGLPNWRYGKLSLQFDPGTGFNYSGEGFVYLGKVIESIKGEPLAQVVEKEIFKPFGMTNSTLVWSPEIDPRKAAGHFYGNVFSQDYYHNTTANPAASLLTNVDDFSKFMIAVMNRKGLSKASYKELFKVQSTPPSDDSHQTEEANLSWGVGWVLESAAQGLKYQHGGNNGDFQSYFELAAEGGYGYVLFANSDRGGKLNSSLKPFLNDHVQPSFRVEQVGKPIPFSSPEWKLEGNYQHCKYLGKDAVVLIDEGTATLNGKYKNAIIEFDIAMPQGVLLGGVQFRRQDEENYENLYLRGHETRYEHALQYTPVFNGSTGWQLYHGSNYCRSAHFRDGEWMHVKMAFHDDWMEVFIDDMDRLALHVFDLKHAVRPGSIQFWSSSTCYFANVSVREVDEYDFFYDRQPKPNPEPGTILNWQVSSPFPDGSLDISSPDQAFLKRLTWKEQACEYNGLVNLGRVQATTDDDDTVIAKFIIESDSDQRKRLQFGYSDIGKILLNQQIIYEGQRIYGSRDDSYYGTIGYFDNIYLDLKKGKNEVWMVVTEYFGGWGVMAKLSDLEGLKFLPAK